MQSKYLLFRSLTQTLAGCAGWYRLWCSKLCHLALLQMVSCSWTESYSSFSGRE